MLKNIKTFIKKQIWKVKYSLYKIRCKIKKQQEYILFGTPLHGNLGDQAIAIAEYEFLKDIKINNVFEVQGFNRKYIIDYLKKRISKDGIIFLNGGGYIGSLWPNEEEMLRDVVEKFPNNKIIIFPQTIFYEENETGKKELEKSSKILNKHSNLTICTRERYSYEFVKKTFVNAKALLVPDIVLYMKNINKKEKARNGILLCMRSDKEKNITSDQENKIYDIISSYHKKIEKTDTVLRNVTIRQKNRKIAVADKLNEFSKYQLIITDRLHGMIFAAITETPCIALGNCNYKVKGVYEWIKHLEYISYVDNLDDIDKEIRRLIKIKECKYDTNIEQKYEELKKEILN